MEMARSISEKGQIVIPKDIRKYLGLKSGSGVTFVVKDGYVIIKPSLTGREFVERYVSVGKKMRKFDSKKLKEELEEQYAIR